MDKITVRQAEVLKLIYKSISDSGYPPTLAELRDALEVSSNQAVLDILKLLEDKGYIEKAEGMARGLRILDKGIKELGLKQMAPVVGVSAAGPYMQTYEINEWRVTDDVQVTSSDRLVRISGDSMIGANIEDGDIVIVRNAKEFKNGDIVLARNDDETTVKRFVHDDGKVYLKPENPRYKNIPIYPETRLLGKIVGILGKSKING
ncbi:MAG: transcriptional repressor LexA [Candidatus Daviesbacteria bacterium]|nr:transcriptional repressor LexA [Candidatus Daviesbacteria bacterium]